MQVKSVEDFQIKSAAKGEVSAVFATFNVVDSDNDVTLPGAFEDGAKAPISQWGHNGFSGQMPAGVGTIRAGMGEAVMDGQYNMDTPHGKAAFATVLQLHESGLGEWSYGYEPKDWHVGSFGDNEKQVRFLVKQLVTEFSPVMRGAGIGTRTLSAKAGLVELSKLMMAGLSPDEAEIAVGHEWKSAIRPHKTATSNGSWDAGAAVGSIPDGASVSELRSMFAWVDSGGDPEAKGSYKFPHHEKAGGPAVVRACIAGIAALNGARGGSSIPDADRAGVYAHLAAHLRAADREPPELRKGPKQGKTQLYDELTAFLAETDLMLEKVAGVVALRAEAGKQLSVRNLEILGWVEDDLRELRRLVDPAGVDEVQREYLRYVATIQGEHL